MLGIIPTTRLALYDVTEALRNAIDGLSRSAATRRGAARGPRTDPTVFSLEESSRRRQELRQMTFAAIEPIVGLHQAIQAHYDDVRSNVDWP